jgi:hypothetical protein
MGHAVMKGKWAGSERLGVWTERGGVGRFQGFGPIGVFFFFFISLFYFYGFI